MMTFDGLTQIYNKRSSRDARGEISRSRRYGRELALILFDIDFFNRKRHLSATSPVTRS